MTERTPTPREGEEEKMDLDSIYSKIQHQMRADRELTHMLVNLPAAVTFVIQFF